MFLGHTRNNDTLNIDHDVLTTHTAVFGSTGSGKTGLLLGMVEELNKGNNVPVILVDIKGDMVNIALQEDSVKVRCLTPGGTHGEAVNVLADLDDTTKASTVISALLSMVGEDPDPIKSGAHAYLSAVLDTLGERDLENLVWGCQNPQFFDLGALDLDDAFPKKARNSLARKLNTLLVSPSFQAWRLGLDLDIDELIKDNGIIVYSVAHLLDSDEQSFAISFLLNEVVRWTRTQKGSDGLRLMLAIDECVGLLPPYPANPPTKEPIMLLLKQARAFGVGCLLATQNPVDIDYKAMSNCNTWFVGRMTAERDRNRVVSGMTAAGVGAHNDEVIASLKPRQFVMARPNEGAIFGTRQVDCDLRGPMVPSEVEGLYVEGQLQYGSHENMAIARAAKHAQSFGKAYSEAAAAGGGDTTEATEQLITEQFLLSEEEVEDYNEEEDYIMNRDKLPNFGEAAIGLGLLAIAAWSFMAIFDVAAVYFKDLF